MWVPLLNMGALFLVLDWCEIAILLFCYILVWRRKWYAVLSTVFFHLVLTKFECVFTTSSLFFVRILNYRSRLVPGLPVAGMHGNILIWYCLRHQDHWFGVNYVEKALFVKVGSTEVDMPCTTGCGSLVAQTWPVAVADWGFPKFAWICSCSLLRCYALMVCVRRYVVLTLLPLFNRHPMDTKPSVNMGELSRCCVARWLFWRGKKGRPGKTRERS